MTDAGDALEAIARAADELVPQLTERLDRYGLGEVDIEQGDLRLRVARWAPAGPAAPASAAPARGEARQAPVPSGSGTTERRDATLGVSSPAVGFFVYAEGLGPGLMVEKGDALGQVEMLGIRHDVRAPRGGTVRHLVAESGEAVEYGQVVVELEPAEARS